MVHDDGNLHNLDTCSVVVVAYCCGMCFGDGVGVVGQVVDGGGCDGGLVYLAQIRKSINQSINQPTNQPNKQSIKQLIN